MPAWQATLWLVVLLAAQWLSWAHRVDHAWGQQRAAAEATGLWAEHDPGSASCQLLDHLGLADALHTAAALPSTLPPQFAVPASRLRSVGHRPAPVAFLARAPPRA